MFFVQIYAFYTTFGRKICVFYPNLYFSPHIWKKNQEIQPTGRETFSKNPLYQNVIPSDGWKMCYLLVLVAIRLHVALEVNLMCHTSGNHAIGAISEAVKIEIEREKTFARGHHVRRILTGQRNGMVN